MSITTATVIFGSNFILFQLYVTQNCRFIIERAARNAVMA